MSVGGTEHVSIHGFTFVDCSGNCSQDEALSSHEVLVQKKTVEKVFRGHSTTFSIVSEQPVT